MAPTGYHFITPVWGTDYTHRFLTISLPSQLSAQNLGFFEGSTHSNRYKIYTKSENADSMRRSPVFARLNAIMETEIILIDDLIAQMESGNIAKYQLMTFCHNHGITTAKGETALVFLTSDIILSDGSFARMHEVANSGKRLILCGGYRVSQSAFEEKLRKGYYREDQRSISIPSRDLIRLSLPHLYGESRYLFWDRPLFINAWPSWIYWRVKGEGIVQRGIFLHPLMIYPRHKEETLTCLPNKTIDSDDYMLRAVPDFADVHVVDDSDEMAIVSTSGPAPLMLPDKPDAGKVARWMEHNCCSHHFKALGVTIRLHQGPLTPEWKEVERASDAVVHSILEGLESGGKQGCMPFAQRGKDQSADSYGLFPQEAMCRLMALPPVARLSRWLIPRLRNKLNSVIENHFWELPEVLQLLLCGPLNRMMAFYRRLESGKEAR